MSEQILWGESLHHPGGEGGPACSYCVCLSLCLSASGCVVVLVLVLVGACSRCVCLPSCLSACFCVVVRAIPQSLGECFATSLGEMLGQSLGYLGRVPSQTRGVLRELFGEPWAKIARKALGILRES